MRSGDTALARERLAWTAVVAVLATALAWLAALNLFLLATSKLASSAALVAGVLLEAGLVVLRSLSWTTPMVLAILAGSAILVIARLVAAGQQGQGGFDRGAHHA